MSPDGTMLAIPAVDVTEKAGDPQMSICIYDLATANLRQLPVADLTPSNDMITSGLAFHDGSKIAGAV